MTPGESPATSAEPSVSGPTTGSSEAPALAPSTRDELLAYLREPPLLVRVPESLAAAFAARKREDTRHVVRIGGVAGLLLGVILVAARMLFFDSAGSPADEQLYRRIATFNLAIILVSASALRIPAVFAHYRALVLVCGALVLAATHAGSILISDPDVALSGTYAAMLGVTVVTVGFRNGIVLSGLTCLLGILGGSGFAATQGATPDWVLASYGYVGASAVGLVIAWVLERQDALRFFQSILLAHEAEERRRLNEQLAAMSRTDSLSGLANRRAFDDTLEAEWTRMRRERAHLSLLFVDIDHFKRFNDAYGHRAGDACLRAVGQAMHTGVQRPTDLAARYGGEEFVLLLPNTDLPGAEAVAQRMLAAVDALQIPHEDSPTAAHLTISIGVATAGPDAPLEPRHLVETADACLYRAKHEGRHRVHSSELRGDSVRPAAQRASREGAD